MLSLHLKVTRAIPRWGSQWEEIWVKLTILSLLLYRRGWSHFTWAFMLVSTSMWHISPCQSWYWLSLNVDNIRRHLFSFTLKPWIFLLNRWPALLPQRSELTFTIRNQFSFLDWVILWDVGLSVKLRHLAVVILFLLVDPWYLILLFLLSPTNCCPDVHRFQLPIRHYRPFSGLALALLWIIVFLFKAELPIKHRLRVMVCCSC